MNRQNKEVKRVSRDSGWLFFRKGCINGFKVVYLWGRILAGGSYGKRDYLYYGNRGSRDY